MIRVWSREKDGPMPGEMPVKTESHWQIFRTAEGTRYASMEYRGWFIMRYSATFLVIMSPIAEAHWSTAVKSLAAAKREIDERVDYKAWLENPSPDWAS